MKKTILVLTSVQALLIRSLLRDYLRSMGDADNFVDDVKQIKIEEIIYE